MKDIGRKIRDLRESQNMTQQELATKVGYKSRVSINKIELQRDLPIKKIVPIAKALGVAPSTLMGWDEDEKFDRMISPEIAKEDIALLTKFSMLKDTDKLIVMNLIDSLLEKK